MRLQIVLCVNIDKYNPGPHWQNCSHSYSIVLYILCDLNMALAFYSCNWESRFFDIIVAVNFASLTNLLFQPASELPTMFSSRAFSAVKLSATLDTKNSLARLSLAFGLVRHTSTVTTPSVQVISKLNDLWAAQFESAILEMRPCPFKFTPQALLSSFYRDCNQDLVVLLDCDCQPEVKISEPS